MAFSAEERKEIQDRVCLEIAKGKSLVRICKDMGGKPSYETIRAWLSEDEAFSVRYAHAREDQADYIADQILEIADTETDPNVARVKIDSRKWLAGKLKAKVYGDKLSLDADVSIKIPDDQLESRLAFLIGKAGVAGALGGAGTPEGTAQVLQHVPGDGTASS